MTEPVWGIAQKRLVNVRFREVIPNDWGPSSVARDPKGTYIETCDIVPRERIQTREGTLYGYPNRDYVIEGIEGEIYPCDKTIFHKTYTVIDPISLESAQAVPIFHV
jgi:hypothetical protein